MPRGRWSWIYVEGTRSRRGDRGAEGAERALCCGWVTAWLLANPHTSYRDIIILYSHPTHSTSHASDPLRTPSVPSAAALRSADSLIRSITWRYHCYDDAALVLNDILLPSTSKQTSPLCRLRTPTVKHLRPGGGLIIEPRVISPAWGCNSEGTSIACFAC